jgi:hypothetical protein
MVSRTFAELVKDLRMRRAVGDKPPVLLLGAGASVDAGIGAMTDLFAFVDCADFDAFSAYIAQTTPAERYRYLSDFLQTRQPDEVTAGYRALAALCAQNYFDLVLTTNMDPLLDDALAAEKLWRRDYLLMVNGVIRPDRLDPLLGAGSPRVKIVKLHGDLFQRFMAWTVPEMDAYLMEVAPYLKPAVAGRDFLVVGYSLRDAQVRGMVEGAGGSVWFTHPQKAPDYLTGAMMRAVIAPECAFERFFPALAHELLVEVPRDRLRAAQVELRAPGAPGTPSAQTLDDMLSSVLAVAAPDGTPSSTAFLLAKPRVIVCDTFAVGHPSTGAELTLVAPHARRFSVRVLRTNTTHPFGPTLLEAPESLLAPGFAFNPSPPVINEVVQTAVAAGEKTGISTGVRSDTIEVTVRIEPLGNVHDLASLNLFARSGSSGAPVVDNALSVRGFIVAGGTDESHPISLMYPSRYWASFLTNEKLPPSRKAKGRS